MPTVWCACLSAMKTIASVIIALSFALQTAVGCPAPDDCRPSRVVLDSDVLSGQIFTVTGGKWRPGNGAFVDLREFRDGEWQSIGKIQTIDRGYFTWLNIGPGDYVLVVALQGYVTGKVNVHVRRRHGQLNRIIIPLKTDACATATVRRSRS